MTFINFFLCLWIIFALLLEPDPDCKSGSGYRCRDPSEFGSRPDTIHSTVFNCPKELYRNSFFYFIIVQPRKCRRSEQRWSRRSRSSPSMWTRSPRRDSQRSELGIRIGDFVNSFSAYYFSKVQLHHFSKIKSQKEVTKQ
jgi:hypothetical protein